MKTITRAGINRKLRSNETPSEESLKKGTTHALDGDHTVCGKKVPSKDPRWIRTAKSEPNCDRCKKALKQDKSKSVKPKAVKPKKIKPSTKSPTDMASSSGESTQ